MRIVVMLVAGLLAVVPAVAQVRIAEPFLQSPGAEQPVQLQSAAITVQRAGAVAHTTIELTLHNPSPRPLEGQLAFPLRDGQQVAGFALDIGGVMVDAVPVAKARGREVFEAVERRRVDPALLERTEGNHFRLRVFPVPAGGERHVRIELVESLRGDGQAWRLPLPLEFAAGLERVTLAVAGAAPQVEQGAGPLGFTANATHDGVSAVLGPRQLKAGSGVVLRWPAGVDTAQTQAFDGDVWFHAELALETVPAPRRLPAKVGLLWDASMSAQARDAGVEFALLDRYFAAVGDVEVGLQVLRDRAAPVQRFRVRGGDWSALRDVLRALTFDGASNLGDWTPQAGVGEYLLFSDGLANYGAAVAPQLGDGQRLFAISSAGARADSARLQALAEAHGGWLVDIAGAAGLDRAAAELLGERPRVMSIDAVGATDVVAASPFPQDGRLRFAGRMTAASAELRINLDDGRGGRLQRRLAIAAGEPGDGRFLAQVGAGWRLRQLLADPERNRTAIRVLGERFGLVTGETSLIVLESLDDYLTYDVPPPAPWRAEFDARRLAAQQSREQLRRDNLDVVAAAFGERQRWWETDFSARHFEAGATIAEPMPAPTMAMPESMMAMPEPSPPAPGEGFAERRIAADSGGAAAATNAPTAASAPPADFAREADQIAVTADVAGNASEADADADEADKPDASAVINVQEWQPDSDFARRLRAAKAADVYALYLDERNANADSPAFFLDVAAILLQKGERDLALRVMSNLAEMQLENRALLRVLGYRLMQADAAALAVPVFERVRTLADEEPQSHRDLGLALDAAGRPQDAIAALYEAVARPWDARFGGIALIALAELNAIVARGHGRLDTHGIDPRLLRNLPLDLRAVLTWDADATDMDLWVTQPDGEQASYSHQDTATGGRLSQDFTGGYGPEEYAIRRGRDGRYRIEVDHFGSSSQLVTGAVTVQVWLSSGFGTPGQHDQRLTVRLEPDSDHLLVGEFEVE